MKRITQKEYDRLNKRIINLSGIQKVIKNQQEAINDLEIKTRILNNDCRTINTKILKIEKHIKKRRKRKR